MGKIKKVAVSGNDIGGLKSSRYEKLQVSYGKVDGTTFVGTGTVAGTLLTISAVFAGTVTISETTMTLASVSSGKLVLGAPVIGPGIAEGTYISSAPTFGGNNTAGTTTCTVSVSQTVAVAAAITLGSLTLGTVINNTAASSGSKAYISAFVSGSGGVGTYTLSQDGGSISSTDIIGAEYGLGETLSFADVPSQDIIRATVVAHADTQPAALDVYPASNKTGSFSLSLPTGVSYPVKLSYVIEYIRGGGRVGNNGLPGDGELFKVIVNTSGLSAPVAEQQISEVE